jgi:hypothetical protein
MAVIAKTLYGTDFAEWSAQTAELLRQRRFDEIDIEKVAEEIRSLGDREFQHARSQLRRMLWDLIKRKLEPECEADSWREFIVGARRDVLDGIDFSPSLPRWLADRLPEIYRRAMKLERSETGLDGAEIPAECPFTLDQLLKGNPTLLHF